MGRNKIIDQEHDNYSWKKTKSNVNNARNKNKIQLCTYSWDYDTLQYINVLKKLGYIDSIIVTEGSRDYVQFGYYKMIKEIPNDLLWKEAKLLAKQSGKKLNRGKRPYTSWCLAVKKVNECKSEMFNKDALADDLGTYFSMFSRLGYLERLDRKGNYRILDKIPENLSSAMANKYLYDKIYKRQRKIEKIRERLPNDDRRDI